MKKRLFVFSLLFILILSPFLLAANETNTSTSTTSTNSEDAKIDKAYQCLEDKVDGKCSDLSSEERIFSALALGKCTDEISKDSKYKNDLKFTAQAILALNKEGKNPEDAEKWLISQNSTPTNLVWYLQVESSQATSCDVSYSGSSNTIQIDDDKKIDSGAGSCLTLAEGGYWLKVSPSCYNLEFEISCDQSFLTNLLYKRSDSPTIYVSEKTTSQSAEGTTTEKVNALCFSQGNSCDYEASLWAALALDHEGYDISSFLPYLITSADENPKFIPESFLYTLTGFTDFRTDLLLKQKNEYWDESGDKFYDSALALYSLQNEEPAEKTKTKNWLLKVQKSDGCWEGNIRNTAFILHSVWPKDSSSGTGTSTGLDCEDSGYFCMSGAQCEGDVLSSYECSYPLKCCSVNKLQKTCQAQGGEICNSNQVCVGGTSSTSSDTKTGEICCLAGSCDVPSESNQNSCESNGGVCRINSCSSGEKSGSYSCSISSDLCCIKDLSGGSGKSKKWLWIILGLVVLVIIGLLFRNKLRDAYWRMKSGRGTTSSSTGSGRPSFPPSSSSRPAPPRRMMPQFSTPARPLNQRRPSEMDEVLKKLKDMSK